MCPWLLNKIKIHILEMWLNKQIYIQLWNIESEFNIEYKEDLTACYSTYNEFEPKMFSLPKLDYQAQF